MNAIDNNEEKELEDLKPLLDKPIGKRLIGEISHSGNQFTSEKLMEAFIVSYIDAGRKVFDKYFKRK